MSSKISVSIPLQLLQRRTFSRPTELTCLNSVDRKEMICHLLYEVGFLRICHTTANPSKALSDTK